MNYRRLYPDEDGQSRVETVAVPLEEVVYAPPAPAMEMSSPVTAATCLHVRFPAGWDSELHPSPRRQLLIMLSGNLMGGLSNGDEFELKPGDVLLMEDVTGKGHTARTLNNKEVLAIMVTLQ